MITINSYLHRDILRNIIRRWMYGELHDSDADLITRIVHFNNVYVSRYLIHITETIFKALHQSDFITRPAFLKSDLKDIIVLNPPYKNSRIDYLIDHYTMEPGRFYRETPFHATLFFVLRDDVEAYIGSSRIKRVHRLAEKSARRIIDWLFDTIKKHADTLADDRAKRLGISKDQLLTSQEEMFEEFIHAENRLLEDFRHRRQIHDEKIMVINDVAGIKVILEEPDQHRLLSVLSELRGFEIVEEERHTGKYNATNLLIRFIPSKEDMTMHPLSPNVVSLMKTRNLTEEETNLAFKDFVRSGEDSIYLEIIVSNYQEMLESEIGRCMHEDRIIEQRLHQPYCSHLAKNVEYLMEYLFTFPTSPHVEIVELPIKIWNRYLPDSFEDVLKKLFQISEHKILE